MNELTQVFVFQLVINLIRCYWSWTIRFLCRL